MLWFRRQRTSAFPLRNRLNLVADPPPTRGYRPVSHSARFSRARALGWSDVAATNRSLRWLSLAVAAGLVACARGPLRGDALHWPLAQWPTFQPYVIAALAIVVILLVARGGGSHRELSNSRMDDASPIALWILPPTVVACAILIVSQLQGSEASGKSSDTIRVANGDQLVLEQASRTPGAPLTGGNLWLVQLRTRRAVVLDPATLDVALRGGRAPQIVKVLEDAYGCRSSILLRRSPPQSTRAHRRRTAG